jgi:hypothetical protein
MLDLIRAWVADGGCLLVSGDADDLIEALFPSYIAFGGPDAASGLGAARQLNNGAEILQPEPEWRYETEDGYWIPVGTVETPLVKVDDWQDGRVLLYASFENETGAAEAPALLGFGHGLGNVFYSVVPLSNQYHWGEEERRIRDMMLELSEW